MQSAVPARAPTPTPQTADCPRICREACSTSFDFPRILQMTFLFDWKFVSFLFSCSNSLPNRLLTDGKCFHSSSEGKESFYSSTRKKSGSSVSSVRHFLCGGFVSNRTSLRQLFKHQLPPPPKKKPTIQLHNTVNRGIKNHFDLTSFSLQVL